MACDHSGTSCRHLFPDWHDGITLPNGSRLMWAVAPDGTRSAWLDNPDADQTSEPDTKLRRIPVHERTGPLPGWLLDLIHQPTDHSEDHQP